MSDEIKKDEQVEVTEIYIEQVAQQDREQESQILSDLSLESGEQKSDYQAFQSDVNEFSKVAIIPAIKDKDEEIHAVSVDIKVSRVGRSINSINHPNLANMEPVRSNDWSKIVDIRAKLTTRGRQAVRLALEEKAA